MARCWLRQGQGAGRETGRKEILDGLVLELAPSLSAPLAPSPPTFPSQPLTRLPLVRAVSPLSLVHTRLCSYFPSWELRSLLLPGCRTALPPPILSLASGGQLLGVPPLTLQLSAALSIRVLEGLPAWSPAGARAGPRGGSARRSSRVQGYWRRDREALGLAR